jgi:hypothetical protein
VQYINLSVTYLIVKWWYENVPIGFSISSKFMDYLLFQKKIMDYLNLLPCCGKHGPPSRLTNHSDCIPETKEKNSQRNGGGPRKEYFLPGTKSHHKSLHGIENKIYNNSRCECDSEDIILYSEGKRSIN